MRGAIRPAIALALAVSSRTALADNQAAWVDRPFILNPWTASANLGVAAANVSGSLSSASGANLEAAIGTPLLIELGFRAGVRPGDGAQAASSDTYARLFNHESTNLGGSTWANPEVRARASVLLIGDTTFGLEARFALPIASGTHFTASPGIPIRVDFPHHLRLDTGLHLLFEYLPNANYTLSAPVALWVQAGDFFVGPMSGVTYTRLASDRFDLMAGFGAGFTVARRVDIKAQVYSPALKLNADIGQTLGVGVGMGVVFP